MAEDEEEARVMRNNKLLLEAFIATMVKKMDEKFEALRRERVNSDQNRDRARQRKEQDLNPKPPDERSRSTRSSSHKISHTPKPKSVIYPDYQSSNELYKFSGKRDYLEWEENMDEWFHCNHILREKRVAYAIRQFIGDAYKWWIQEVDDRWYNNEPIITSWRELKKVLRKKYAPQRLSRTAQTNATVQRLGVQEKKPALVSDQKEYEELDKRVLEALKAVAKSQKEKSSGEPKQCESSNLSKSRGVTCYHCRKKGHFISSCPEKLQLTITSLKPKLSSPNSSSEVVEQGLENSSSCVMHLFLSKGVDSGQTMEHESDKAEGSTKEKNQSHIEDQEKQNVTSEEEQTKNKPVEQLAYLTNSLEAKCILSSIQSEFVLEKLIHLEPEHPSIISFSQILEEKSQETTQRSLPLISDMEQQTSLVPKYVLMPFSYDYPRKHCKEIDLVRTEPNLFVIVSAQEEKRFGLENVKEFCVSKSVFDKMIPTFETLTLEKIFKPEGFMFDEFREFNSSLRVSLSINASELFKTKIEYALVKTFSELKNMLCESNLLNVLCKPTLKDDVFELSTSSIMHLFCPISVQKGTGALAKYKYLGEELTSYIQIKENHFGMWNWKYLRKSTSIAQGCFDLKFYIYNYMTNCLISFYVPKLFPFDVGDLVFLKFKSINQELGKVVKDSSMFKEKPPDLHQPQSNLMITKKKEKGSGFQKPKQLFVYKETLMSLTNPEQVIPSKIKCLLQEFEENNPGGLPPFFGLEHQFIDESGALSKTFLYIIQSKQGKTHVVSDAMTQRYEFLAIPEARLLDFEHTKESYDSINGIKDVFQSYDQLTFEKHFRTKGFVLDKIKLFELNCFLNDSVFVFDNLSKIAYYISYVKTKESFSVSNPFTEGFDILVYNQIFDEHVENYTFCTYDPVFGVFVVKEQVMQGEGVKAHAPETWLFNLWLLRFTVQVDYDPWKHLRNEQEEWQGNKWSCRMIFEPGGCLWIQMKCLPNQKKIQPMPRIAGPFNTRKLISNNPYLHNLQGKCNMRSNFKVSNLVLFNAEELDLRSNPFQVGEDDVILESTKNLKRVKELVAEEELGIKEQLGAEEHNEPDNELIAEKEYEKDVILTSLVLIHDLQMGMCLICTLFPLSSFVPMGFLDKVFNEANDSHPNHPFDDQDWARTFKKPSQGLAIKSSLF